MENTRTFPQQPQENTLKIRVFDCVSFCVDDDAKQHNDGIVQYIGPPLSYTNGSKFKSTVIGVKTRGSPNLTFVSYDRITKRSDTKWSKYCHYGVNDEIYIAEISKTCTIEAIWFKQLFVNFVKQNHNKNGFNKYVNRNKSIEVIYQTNLDGNYVNYKFITNKNISRKMNSNDFNHKQLSQGDIDTLTLASKEKHTITKSIFDSENIISFNGIELDLDQFREQCIDYQQSNDKEKRDMVLQSQQCATEIVDSLRKAHDACERNEKMLENSGVKNAALQQTNENNRVRCFDLNN